MKPLLPLLAVGLLACGNDSTSPNPVYASMAGSYVAPAVGNATNGTPINASVAFTVAQTGGTVSGTYSITFMTGNTNIVQSGSFSGTMSTGNYPTVTLTLDREACAGYSTQYTGTYDPGVKRLTVTGYVDVTSIGMVNGVCTVAARMSTTLVLQR